MTKHCYVYYRVLSKVNGIFKATISGWYIINYLCTIYVIFLCTDYLQYIFIEFQHLT